MSLVALHACAQESHWGAQAEGGYFVVPEFVIEKIHSLPELPTIQGPSVQTGLVHFNSRGAPSFALQYSHMWLDLEGSLSDPRGTVSVSGSGLLRGFMATKYLNFITRDRFSAGLALGGGVGALNAAYTRSAVSATGTTALSQRYTYDYVIPMFEILGRADIRVTRYITIGPFYGIRNGAVGGGGTLRIDFAR